jgi:hypothetical protein
MRKFIVHVERGGKISVMEVEIEVITAVEDQSVMWLPEGEYKARLMAPQSFYEKQEDGTMAPTVWYSHAFCWTVHQAWAAAERMVRAEMLRALSKHSLSFTEEDIKAKLAEIQEILLP